MNWADFKIAERAGLVVDKKGVDKKFISPYFTSGETILSWANNPNGVYKKFVLSYGNIPSDVPVNTEGWYEVKIDEETNRRKVFFYQYGTTDVYEREIWQGAWRTNWTKSHANVADLANYLPKSGGKLSNEQGTVVIVENTNENIPNIRFQGISGSLGNIGFNGADNPTFWQSNGYTAHSLLHTGNITGDYTNVDFNNVRDTFKMYCNPGAPSDAGATNSPINGTGILFMYNAGNVLSQQYVTHSGSIYSRSKYNSDGYSWSNWANHLTTANSARVKIQSTAPTDTSDLWVW